MSRADRLFLVVLLEKTLLEKKEQEFEDFFVLAGTTLWGRDFEPWRPQGRFGDMKCDGYRISEKAVFQCHAPEKFEASKVATKIQVDFNGARKNFDTKMQKWVFVHNHKDGLPAAAAMLVLELRERHPNITIETWTPDDLIQQILKLPESDVGNLFPTLLKDQQFSEIALGFMEEVVNENRTTAPGIEVEPRGQLNRLTLDDALDKLDKVDREVRRRVLGYSRWYDPAAKAKIFEKLATFEHEQRLVEDNAQRLQDDGLIQITENHYLPLNEEICQQAAESLMDEFLRELEE
jgi:hypothetical protein